MTYLASALYAEGPTDYAFLRPLLRRACEDLCIHQARGPVEIGDVLELDTRPEDRNKSRAECIVGAAIDSRAGWHVLFIHADADGDGVRARAERITPAVRQLEAELGTHHSWVAVVPVQMTDAWLLADFQRLREVLGTTLDASQLGIPTRGPSIERIADPKQALESAWRIVHGRRRRAHRLSSIYQPLGEQIQLVELRKLEAYVEFERELAAALRRLRYIP